MSDAPKTKTVKTAPVAETTVTGPVGGITMPEIKRGSNPKYDYDSLGVGECFGVKGKTKKQMANSVSNANRKYKSVDGQKVRYFTAFNVDDALKTQIAGTPLEGSDVLVFRKK